MEEIMVSILCAAYNHERYIRQCLDGFIMQKTNFKYEVIVHDDASTDNTAQIIREYQEKYPDIIKPIYQTENQYSKGIKITSEILPAFSKGKYIALCEGDDFWTDENKLQMQLEALEQHPECKMCVHKVEIFDEKQREKKYYPSDNMEPKLKTGIIDSYNFIRISLGIAFQTSSYFFDSKTFEKYVTESPLFKQISPVGDVPLLLYFGNKAPVYYIEDEMSCYRKESIGSWSWGWRQLGRKEYGCRHLSQMVRVYREYDKYTNGEYHELIGEKIFQLLWGIEAYREMRKKEFKKLRKHCSLRTRVYFFLKAYFPRLMKLLKK